jgi:hypothetical protein
MGRKGKGKPQKAKMERAVATRLPIAICLLTD